MDLGNIISALRVEKGIYQKELADYLNVSIGTVSNYEQGIHNPDLDTLCKIADYYQVSTDYLMGRTDFRADLEELDRPFTDRYTVTDMVNTAIQLDSAGKQSLVEYLEFLKSKQDSKK